MIAFVITVPTLALMLPMTAVVLWAYWQCVKWLSVRVDRWWLKRADAIRRVLPLFGGPDVTSLNESNR